MPSFKALLLLPILSLAATTAAQSCPESWFENTYRGDSKCCYGHMMIEDTDASCCVNYVPTAIDEAITSTTSTTTATTSTSPQDYWSGAGDCLTKVPFTASDYSSRVSAGSSKAASAADASSTAAVTLTPTSTNSESTASSGASSTLLETSSTDNFALPVATAENIVLGGAAVAAALFAL